MTGGLISSWWWCWPPTLLLGYWACALRLTQGSWFAPAVAWAAFWTGALAFPLILAPDYPVSPAAVWVIVAISFFISVGAAAAQTKLAATVAPPLHSKPAYPLLIGTLLLLSFPASCLAAREFLHQSGAGFNALTSMAALQNVAQNLSVQRYSGTVESVQVRLLLAYVYFASIVAGAAYPQFARWHFKLLTLFPLLGSLLLTAVTSAKAGFLFCVILWAAAFLVSHQRAGGRMVLRASVLLRVALLIAILVGLFTGLLELRYGNTDDSAVSRIGLFVESTRIYLFGHVSVFSGWWEYASAEGYDLQWGRRLFFGPTAMVGLNERVLGAYDLVNYKEYNLDSNVFTVYRAIIEDYSLFGALVISFGFGYVAGRGYAALRNDRSGFATIILVAFYAILLSSHVNNIFGYTTILAAFLAFCLIQLLERLPHLLRRTP